MNVILMWFLVIFVVTNIVLLIYVQGQNFGGNDLKYIDSLPEKDKKEFVERVARRILSEVKPLGVPKDEIVLITDEELNKTSDYVNKVVKEESIKFENIRQHNVSENNNTVIISNDDVLKYETTTSENPTNIENVQEVHAKTRKNGNISKNVDQTNESATMKPGNLNLQESKNASEDLLRSDPHIDLTKRRDNNRIQRSSAESDKNEASHLEDPKNDIHEQVSVKADVSSTTQITDTILILDNFTLSNDHKITDSVPVNPKVTDSNVLNKRHNENVLDSVKSANIEDPTTVLFEPSTEEQVKNERSILVESPEDALTANINKNESSIISNVATAIRSNNTKSLRNLDSESIVTFTKNNDPNEINKKITTEKESESVKDDTTYLKILNTKYVETLPPDFGNVEVQIPKPDENNSNKLPPSEQKVRRYDVFEVESEKSAEALLLRVGDTRRDNQVTHTDPAQEEAPHYAPIHDYAAKNAYFNPYNNLGPNSNDENHTIIEAGSGKPFFPLRTPDDTGEAPHYAPIHNYAPENAYYNGHNLFGPNAEDEEQAESFANRRRNDIMEEISFKSGPVDNINEDYYSLRSGKGYDNVNRKFDFEVRKPTGYQKSKQASADILDQPQKSRTLGPDDYFDMDYFFGRAQTNNDNISDPPFTLGGANYSLKDVLKKNRIESRDALILTILKELTKEAKVSRSGHGFAADYYWSEFASGSRENKQRLPVFRSNKKKEIDIKSILRNNFDEANEILMDENVSDNYNFVEYEEVPTLKEDDDNGTHTESIKEDDNDKTIDKLPEKNDEISKISNEHDNKTSHKKNVEDDEKSKNSFENDNNNKSSNGGKGEITLKYDMHLNIEAKINKLLRSLDLEFVIEPYVTALENLIKNNSEGLRKYDWLGTTVDLQAALDKLINLADSDPNEDIHPNDKAILKYIQFLYDSAQEVQSADLILRAYLRANARRGILPRSKRKSKHRNAIKMLEDFHRMLRKIFKNNENVDQQSVVLDDERDNEGDEKLELLHFFVDLRSSLYQFHNALKHISLVTKYKTQKWYENLKELYLGRPKRKQLLEVLLHLFSIRLFGLIEASAKNGLEEDYLSYVLEHKNEVRRTKDELVFVIKLVNELKRMDDVD